MRRFVGIPGGLALLALLALSACNGGDGARPLYAELALNAQDIIARNAAERAQASRPPVTRAALNTLEGSFIEVTLERTGQQAYLAATAVRTDESPGEIVQWRTGDNVTLTTRAGVLIATRGLGGHLISSDVTVDGARGGPAGSGARILFIRTGDVEEVALTMACDVSDMGRSAITIVEQVHQVRHLRERCEAADGGRVTYDYWIDSREPIIWQAREWAGPHIGYMKIRRVTR
jgi:hypothetical protein